MNIKSDSKEVVETYDGSNDEALLLVRGVRGTKEENKMYVKQLAVAISTTFQKHQVVRLRCIGNGAIGNTVKAHAIAASELHRRGIKLVADPSWKTVDFDGQGTERTSIVYQLQDAKNVTYTDGV